MSTLNWLMACVVLLLSSVGYAKPATIWLEAEDAAATNFLPGPIVQVAPGSPSGYATLRLYVQENNIGQTKLPFFAELPFTVKTAGKYHMWLAASAQNVGWASPCRYRIDQHPFVDLKGKEWSSAPYGGPQHELGWFLADTLDLKPGAHTLRFEIQGPRAYDKLFVFFFDAVVLTTDDSFKPAGNHPEYSPYPLPTEFKPGEQAAITDQVEQSLYRHIMARTDEQVSPATTAEVLRKIEARPLPETRQKLPHEFGLHGIEKPFIDIDNHADKAIEAYELLARAGADGFRTAEGCWHRLGPSFDRFDYVDFELDQAHKYGMTHLMTIGYPTSQYTVSGNILSAVKPEYYGLYRQYLRALFNRIKGKGVEYVELGNEVDAPETWWRKSTAAMYINELRMVKEELSKIDPSIKIVALAATRSRTPKGLTDTDGRAFVRQCFALGMDHYADAYSVHYVDQLASSDFVSFMRQEMARAGSPNKPIIDSEQSALDKPCDVVRTFARCFFLYDMKRVDYYMARDAFGDGRLLIGSSLFDCQWNPKLRLLAYAASVDAMKGRVLIGIAQPAPGIEAYVLKYANDYKANGAPYSIVMWNHNRELLKLNAKTPIPSQPVTGIRGAVASLSWRLDYTALNANTTQVKVSEVPVIVFTNKLPDWQLLSPEQYLDQMTLLPAQTR